MNDTIRQKHAKMARASHRIWSPSCCSRPSSASTRRSPPTLFGAAADDDGKPLYDVVTCGLTAGPRRRPPTASTSCPPPGPKRSPTADTVIVPGTRYPPAREQGTLAPEARAALDSIRPGTRLVSICTGAFVLAAAGLLDGRVATTHWKFADALRRLHPDVRVDERVLFVDDGDVLTSAGLAAGIDLCLHIIRTDHGAAGGQRGGQVLRGAAVARGRAGAVHRPAHARRPTTRRPPPPASGRCSHLDDGADRRATGPPRPHEPADVQPPIPRGDRPGTGNVDPQPPRRPRPRAARVTAICPSTRWPGAPVSAPAATCVTTFAAASACRRRVIARSIKALDGRGYDVAHA